MIIVTVNDLLLPIDSDVTSPLSDFLSFVNYCSSIEIQDVVVVVTQN